MLYAFGSHLFLQLKSIRQLAPEVQQCRHVPITALLKFSTATVLADHFLIFVVLATTQLPFEEVSRHDPLYYMELRQTCSYVRLKLVW